MKLNNKTVVLTGAASGIGRALAEQLVKEGCHLALIDRDEKGLVEAREHLKTINNTISTHVVDLSDRDATNELRQEVMKEHDRVHMLINNAGVALGGTFEEVSSEDFDWLMRINFHAVVDLTRAFLPILKAHGEKAKIVNISSLYGIISPPGQSAYCASKFAVRGFSNALCHELAETNVGVLVVHPGGIATSIATNAKVPADTPQEEVEKGKREMNRLLRMPPSQAAITIIDAITSDRKRVIVGSDAIFLSILERLMPVKYWSVVERLMNRRRTGS
ncbi:SDR family oxidoreductase [Alteromonadaceae bacterium M269]|nr:SDR family oxidoreductase [Alteromonadaceae bacterium M269]